MPLENLSKIGLGTYRMSAMDKAHARAFNLAVKYGCNLIDTSSNYMYGESENLIGRYTIEHPRNKLFVVTKAGYVTRNEMRTIKGLGKKSLAENDVVTVNTTTHCIHPDFLKSQIKKSLKRLNRKRLDGFLLHNPEYYLKSSVPDKSKKIYYDRIRQAFEFLEEMVHLGHISNYGVSSNTLSIHDAPLNTSLGSLLKISAAVASVNHFKIIQFPFNMFEQGPATDDNGNGSLIATAVENKLTTLSNRPLNCHASTGFIRLASYDPMTPTEIKDAESSYDDFLALITKKLKQNGVEESPLEFQIIGHFDENWKKIGNHSSVDALFVNYLSPFLNTLYNNTIPDKNFIGEAMNAAEKKVIVRFYNSCKKFSTQVMSQECQRAIGLLKKNGQLPSSASGTIPAIVCDQYLKKKINHVLVGMTREKYVEELRHLF